jgi:hypothetical protein
MKFKHILSLALLLCISLFSSCYYDVENELYLIDNCDTENQSYSNNIVPILNRYCITCHNDNSVLGAGISFDSYEQLIVYVENGSLLSSIKQESGAIAMPPTGQKATDCEIEKIQSWIDSGAPNN